VKRGNNLHEEELQRYIQQAKSEGRKIIDLAARSPDAIEAIIVNGQIELIAIEVLPSRWSNRYKAWKHPWTFKQKEESYRMFDKVKILGYKLPK
jgi:hypothetical protein